MHRLVATFAEPLIVLAIVAAMALAGVCTPTADGADLLTPNAIPIGVSRPFGSGWTTDIELYNPSSTSITQKVTHLTFTKPGFDPRIVEDTVTLAPGETRWLMNASADWDDGLWVLQVDPRLDAASFLHYRDISHFEVRSVRPFTAVGDNATYQRVLVNPSIGWGTFPTVMNTGTRSVRVEYVLTGPLGERINDWFQIATPGISQTPVPSYIPIGGSLRACLEVCNVGAGGSLPPVYIFVAVGPSSGATQAIRYP